MKSYLTWDEDKRRKDLEKHGLDFANATISFRSASKEESEEYHAWLEDPDQS